MDHVERYLEIFEGLRRSKRWSTDTNILRFCALTLAAAETAETGFDLEAQQAALVACMAAASVATTTAAVS